VEDFIINKRLGKNPEDYPDAKSQPHVQVAKRMKEKGQSARLGNVISYIFCLEEGQESAKSAQADRARSVEELKRSEGKFKIDYEFYLSNQILPPIERLCDSIEGTDRSRLAECLGLDPNRYRSTSTPEENHFASLDSQISDELRFKDAEPFKVRCKSCHATTDFPLLHDRTNPLVKASGAVCMSCQKSMNTVNLQLQLEAQIRAHIARYYEKWTVCDEQTCTNRTRSMGVYGKRCLKPGCRGRVTFEYSDTMLYNQLRYYKYLFDREKAIKVSTGMFHAEEVLAVVGQQATMLGALSDIAEKYLRQCGRRWIDLTSVFSVLKLT